jgi:hypothetical protein
MTGPMQVLPSQAGTSAVAAVPEQRSDGASFRAALNEELDLKKGEKVKPVDGHAYADIVSGKRKGMYLNTSGNERHGEAFVLVKKKGVEYHIYGSGKDRLVVALKPAAEPKPKPDVDAAKEKAPEPAEIELRKGEKAEPVAGHGYSEIVSGARSGMYVNTSGGPRHGEAFVLVRKGDMNYHIYGSGEDRQVIAVKRDDDDRAARA